MSLMPLGQPKLKSMPLAIVTSDHARVRARQRSVELRVLDCLIAYGHHEHDHRGAVVVVFDRFGLACIERFEPADLSREVNESRNLYAVVDSYGCVVTTGYRYRRVVRDMSLSNLRPRRRRRVRS